MIVMRHALFAVLRSHFSSCSRVVCNCVVASTYTQPQQMGEHGVREVANGTEYADHASKCIPPNPRGRGKRVGDRGQSRMGRKEGVAV